MRSIIRRGDGYLRQDHSMMAHLITGLVESVDRTDSPAVLETLSLEVSVERALDPL